MGVRGRRCDRSRKATDRRLTARCGSGTHETLIDLLPKVGQDLRLNLRDEALCIEDRGNSSRAQVIDCADVSERIAADPGMFFSLVYDETGTAWRVVKALRAVDGTSSRAG